MKIRAILSLCSVLVLALWGTTAAQDSRRYAVQPVVRPQSIPFALSDVRLRDGSPFKQAMDRNAAYLLQLEPDRLLHRWRTNAGLPAKADYYGGWEGPSSGSSHMLGHYLSALSIQYAASGDQRFLDRLNYTVAELAETQRIRQTGYIGGIPKEDSVWRDVTAGRIHSQGFDLNGAWVPWYMLHKVWAGLIDAYLYAGNEQAKEVVIKLSDWACLNFSTMPDNLFQQMLNCEYGGMNEVLAEVYALTGDKKYLTLSLKFNHQRILDPLAKQVDKLAGEHANTQIPKVIGVARQYELTGNPRDRTIADYFWEAVVNDHSYVNGGNSNYEHFQDAGKLNGQLSANTTETCNTYNMLKLTRHRFMWQPSAALADYYERALYNHILASQHPQTGMLCYYTPLQSGRQTTFSTPFDSFWCCVGTGIENHAKYAESIYFKGADGSLYVNLFIASDLSWPEKQLKLQQETDYPLGETTTLTIQEGKAATFPLHIRYPKWAKKGMVITVNGQPVQLTAKPGSYATINRKWQKSDVIRITIPMSLYTEPMPDNARRVGVLYGPLVLAGALGEAAIKRADLPVLVVNNRPVDEWVKPVVGHPMQFRTAAAGRPNDVDLTPFYMLHDQKHMIYWDLFSDRDWANQKAVYAAEQKRQQDLEARTIDLVRLGEMQPEKDHNVQSSQSSTGETEGRKWRDARSGGWFSFELACDPDKPVAISSLYYGGDQSKHSFEVMVEGVKIASDSLLSDDPATSTDGLFIEHVYPVSSALTAGKKRITVRFQASSGQSVRSSFGVRLVRQSSSK